MTWLIGFRRRRLWIGQLAVDRRGKRVIHVGFADGFREEQSRPG